MGCLHSLGKSKNNEGVAVLKEEGEALWERTLKPFPGLLSSLAIPSGDFDSPDGIELNYETLVRSDIVISLFHFEFTDQNAVFPFLQAHRY